MRVWLKAGAIALLLLWLGRGDGHAQIPTRSGLDGTTHPGEAGGSPTGSLLPSVNESVNLFSGKLAFQIPLLAIGGRGSAGYTMTLRIQQQWRMFNNWEVPPSGPGSYKLLPAPNWWEPLEGSAGFGPGILIARTGATQHGNYPLCPNHAGRVLTRLTFVAPDGTEQDLRDTATDGRPTDLTLTVPQCLATNLTNRGRIFKSYDGSAMTFISDTDILDEQSIDGGRVNREITGFLFMADGTRYRISRGVVDWISDRNGNVTKFTYETTGGCEKCRVVEIRDPLNRRVSITYAPGADTITYKGFQGQQGTITVTYGIPYSTFCVASPLLYPKYTPKKLAITSGPSLFGGSDVSFLDYCLAANHSPASLRLANGDTYTFYYNDYSELVRVTLPTGGGYLYEYEGGIEGGGSYVGDLIYRRVKSRKEFTSGALEQEVVTGATTYTYVTPAGGAASDVTETRQHAGGSTISKTVHYFRGSPRPLQDATAVSYSYSDEGREYKTEYFDADGTTLLRRETHEHEQRAAVGWWQALSAQERADKGQSKEPTNDLRVAATTTVRDPGSNEASYKLGFGYDSYNNQTSVTEFDFDGTTELRRTVTTYLTSYASRDYDSIAGYNPTLGDVAARVAGVQHIRTFPRQSTVFRGACAVSRATYEYDQQEPSSRTNVTQRLHNAGLSEYVSYQADPYGGTLRARGNLTAITQSLAYNASDPSSQCVGGTGITTTREYDILGNIVKVVDARNNATMFGYEDSFVGDVFDKGTAGTFAFGTRVTNAKNHVVESTFDYNSGRLRTQTDANFRQSGFGYDILGRLTAASYPDGGSVGYAYTTSTGTIRSSVSRTSTSTIITDKIFDGLGRLCETRTVNGVNVIRALMVYDGASRHTHTSSPYYASASAGRCVPVGVEQYASTTFDALDRVKESVAPDGSREVIDRKGKKTTVTDPATVKREMVADALDRLSWVTEDPGGTLAYTTYYAFDMLDNLIEVCPGTAFDIAGNCSAGRKRRFRYDSLGRLRRAENPEVSQVTYEYDNNSNLYTKTDPRYTITHGYDELDRLSGKTYSGVGGGSSVTLCYDSSVACGGTAVDNSIGRLVQISNADGKTRIDKYDTMGRVLTSTQTVTGEVSRTFDYAYDLAGNMRWQRFPSQRELQIDFDAAGRATKIGRLQGSTVTPFGDATLLAHGSIDTLKLGWAGSTEVLTETWQYNARLQPIETKLVKPSSPSTNVVRLQYFYCPNEVSSCTTNNGNLRRQRIQYGALPNESSFSAYQDFVYDKLNRVTEFKENDALVERQGYDPHGNRWVEVGAIPGTPTPLASTWFSGSTNQMTGVAYDGSGNQTQYSPFTLTYDAENRVVGVTSTSNGSASYSYDGNGRRVRSLRCNAPAPCLTTTPGVIKTEYLYDVFGQLSAEYSTPANSDSGIQFYTVDQLGSTRVVADGNGEVVRRYDYRPFGWEIAAGTNGRSNKYSLGAYPGSGESSRVKFTGKERDSETGLDYFGARYMSAAQGRFTSPDPFTAVDELIGPAFDDYLGNPQYWNKYAYSLNNPLKYKDPDGEFPHAVTGAFVGGGIGGALELYSQVRSGQEINWAKVGTKAGLGAAVGATAAATFGTSLIVQGLSVGAVNTVGGIADRALDRDPITESLNETAIITDAGVGVVAGGVGGLVGGWVQGAVKSSTGQKLNERLADHAVRASAGRSASRQARALEAEKQVLKHPEEVGRKAAGAGRAAAKAGATELARRAAEALKKRNEEEER